MKPSYGRVLELPVSSDFSHFAMQQAMEMIEKDMIAPNGEYPSGKIYYSLKIGVEGDIMLAMDQARTWEVNLSLCRTFEDSEWQIEARSIDPDVKNVTLWCGGA
jgi:hypothetical protein